MGNKICIWVNIYRWLPKLGMSTHVFKISLCYDNKWEIKLCISVNIYRRLLKLGMSTHVFKISSYYDNKWEIKYVSELISIIDFQNLVWVLMFSKLAYAMIKNGKNNYVS